MRRERMLGHKDCTTANELLDELDVARGHLWQKNRDSLFSDRGWVFRGVWDATTPLRPSAFRQDAFAPFHNPAESAAPIDSAEKQRNWEDRVLVDFCTEVDHLGFHVPGDRPELRDPRLAILRYDPHRFPPIEKLHMCALAQHYGVPTRLLDWTRQPLIAAYFAVEKFTRLDSEIAPDHRCVVWALDQGLVQEMARRSVRRETNRRLAIRSPADPDIFFVTAPLASKPNLAAQSGVFTLVQPRSGDPHPIPDIDEALGQLARRVPNRWASDGPFLHKFTLPATQARLALRLLAAKGVHAGTVRPGFASIVDMYRERRHHHRDGAPPLIKNAKS